MTTEEAIARQSIARAVEIARERIAKGVYPKSKEASNLICIKSPAAGLEVSLAPTDDGTDLEASCAAAEDAFDRLGRCINALAEERQYLGIEGWHALDAYGRAMMRIGGLSIISESGKKRVASVRGKSGLPKRVKVKSAKAMTWRAKAEPIAIELHAKHPDWSKSSLATELRKRLGKRAKGLKSLRTLLSKVEENNWKLSSLVS
jgi:hypothetical protein